MTRGTGDRSLVLDTGGTRDRVKRTPTFRRDNYIQSQADRSTTTCGEVLVADHQGSFLAILPNSRAQQKRNHRIVLDRHLELAHQLLEKQPSLARQVSALS